MASMYYFGGGAAVTAFFTAVLAHELGHLLALAAAGAHVRGVRVSICGFVIEYGGELTLWQEMGVAAAGPVAGLSFAALCILLGTPYFRYAGLIALLAAAFNLLPVLPLDGGRLTRALLLTVVSEPAAERWMRALGSACGAGVFVTGAFLKSPPAAAVGIWLAALANFP